MLSDPYDISCIVSWKLFDMVVDRYHSLMIEICDNPTMLKNHFTTITLYMSGCVGTAKNVNFIIVYDMRYCKWYRTDARMILNRHQNLTPNRHIFRYRPDVFLRGTNRYRIDIDFIYRTDIIFSTGMRWVNSRLTFILTKKLKINLLQSIIIVALKF